MDRRVIIRRFITDTKNWLLECGAEYVKKSDDSNSTYMSVGGTKIRISDHFAGFIAEDQINVIFPTNNAANPVVIYSNAVMSYASFRDLKFFLKSFCEMRLCEYFCDEAKLDQKLLQKQAKCNVLTEDIKKKALESDRLAKQVATRTKELEKLCGKIERIKGMNIGADDPDVSCLSKNQKKQIMDLILTYKH